MRKLIKKLNKWFTHTPGLHVLTKWQRDNIYDFIIQFIEEVTK